MSIHIRKIGKNDHVTLFGFNDHDFVSSQAIPVGEWECLVQVQELKPTEEVRHLAGWVSPAAQRWSGPHYDYWVGVAN